MRVGVFVTAAQVVVNGRGTSIADVPTHTTALDWLRDIGLTGCKEGCAEGECGACSILVARPGIDAPTEWVAINACLVPIAALDGQELITAEGLGTPDALHPVQQELAVRGGSQCGYCTPGFVCSMAAEYYRPGRTANGTDAPERGANGFDLHALSGNLCRCTGYRPIRDAAYALGQVRDADPLAARTLEPARAPRGTRIRSEGRTFARPTSLAEALQLLHDDPVATVVAGATDWGVEVNLRGARADSVIAVDLLPELRELTVGAAAIEIGAALSLTEIERRLAGRVPILAELFVQFASRLIRNTATIGGNLGTGSPIGDAAPVLLALNATVVLAGRAGDRDVLLADYFTGYRRSVRRPDELIRSVRIPLPLANTTAFHKIAKRRFDDISSLAVGFALDVADGEILSAHIGLGGVAATPIRARNTEAALVGRPWSQSTVDDAAMILRAEGTPIDDHRASAAYRVAMLEQSLRKLYVIEEEAAV
jgi:xanthine dehydrogenase small subunit